MEERPTAAFVLVLLGGIFLLLGGLVAALAIIGVLGVVLAVVVIVGAVQINSAYSDRKFWSGVVLALGIVGFGPWNLFGAFLVGSILTIVGAVLGLTFEPRSIVAAQPLADPGVPWVPGPVHYSQPSSPGVPGTGTTTPLPPGPAPPPPGVPRHCPECNAPVLADTTFCGACGARLR